MKLRSWVQMALICALVLSVVANVFLLGFVARGAGENSAGALTANIGQIYPAEVRTEFREVLRENRPRALAALADLREARRNLAAAVEAASLDEAAARRAMDDVRQATDELQRLMHEFLIEALRQARDTSR